MLGGKGRRAVERLRTFSKSNLVSRYTAVGKRCTQDWISTVGYQETSQWVDVHKTAMVGAVAVVFNFKINCLVQIKYLDQNMNISMNRLSP